MLMPELPLLSACHSGAALDLPSSLDKAGRRE